jgi:hypothetical protein
MERFSITKTGQSFRIEGFPDAIKVLRITGRQWMELPIPLQERPMSTLRSPRSNQRLERTGEQPTRHFSKVRAAGRSSATR